MPVDLTKLKSVAGMFGIDVKAIEQEINAAVSRYETDIKALNDRVTALERRVTSLEAPVKTCDDGMIINPPPLSDTIKQNLDKLKKQEVSNAT